MALFRANFLVRCVALLVLLLFPWPGLGGMCGATFCGVANEVAELTIGPSLEFAPASAIPGADHSPWDVVISARDPVSRAFVRTALDARRAVYVPSAVFLALALALRVPSRMKKIALIVIGLAAAQIGPWLAVLSFFSGKLPVVLFHFSAPAHWLIEIAYRSLAAPPGMAYALPALVWLGLVWTLAPECL